MIGHVDFDVQVQMGSGSPALSIVDLPDKAVAGSRERVSTTLDSIGRSQPPKWTTVNLVPASLAYERGGEQRENVGRSDDGLSGKVFGESMEIPGTSRYGTFVDTKSIVSACCSLHPDNELHRVGGGALLDSPGL